MFGAVRVLLLGGLVGKLLGVMRELLFAWLFGTGTVAAAFRLAQSAFLIPLQGVVSEAINGAFIPLYASDHAASRGRAAAIFDAMHLALLGLSSVVAVALFIFAADVVAFLGPGFDAPRLQAAASLLRVLACAMPFYVLSALYGAVQLALGGGQMLAARAALQSLGLIGGAVVAFVFSVPAYLAAGFFFAYLYLTVAGARFVRLRGLRLVPWRALESQGRQALYDIWKIFRILIWIPIALQLNFVLERQVASVVDVHAMAALDYARFINETLIILIAMPFGLAGLSGLAGVSSDEAHQLQLRALKMLLYAGIPLAAAIHVHALALVRLLFERGAFDFESSKVTAAILESQALGIWAQLLGYAGTKFLAARGNARLALISTVLGVGASVAVLMFGADALGPRVLGLASALQGLVFGLCVLVLLRLARALALELMAWGVAAGLYLALLAFTRSFVEAGEWACLILTGLYWLITLLTLKGSRSMLAMAMRGTLIRLRRGRRV